MSKSRVNITLQSKTDGAAQKKELPLKLLVLGRFGGSLKRWTISKENLDQVLAKIAPRLDIQVSNKIKKDDHDFSLHLNFEKLKDFHPDHLLLKIPALHRLVAMRNLLKDLKAQLLDNPLLRQELEKLLTHREKRAQIYQELNK